MKFFLSDCAEIEENVARIYRLMASNEALSADLRETLRKMAIDEDQHAEKIRFALRLSREGLFSGAKVEHQRVKELQDESRQLVAELEKRSFSEEEALITMIRLERDFCQVHIEVVAQFTDPRMLKLFESLAGDDESHRQTLESYLARVASGG